AVLAFTAVLCSFASCGNDVADKTTEESSVTSISEEVTEEETTEEMVTEEVTTEEETTVETTDENAEYQEIIENFFECSANNDIDGIIKVSYPDKYFDTIKLLYETEIIDPLCFQFLDTISFKNFNLYSIDSTEPLAQDYISLFDDNYGQFQTIGEYIEQNGTENVDEIKKITGELQLNNAYFHVENAVKLTCMLSREPVDDSWDESEYESFIDWEFILYYIDGEGWKIDFWLVSSMYETEKEAVYQETEYIYNSAETVLSETETESENFIVSSDSSKNYNVSSEFADNFVNGISKYYQKNDNLEYFIVVENGEISNVSGVYEGKPKSFSSFPDKYKYTEDDYIILSYEEDYQICLDKIK
ncbi:MAG: hypothetical protein K2J44_08925, partial [Ruminococcus sp.]|nr:hypothetical protein [Ruminococcus sp.]